MSHGLYGELKIGRLTLLENFTINETFNGEEAGLDIEAQESTPPLTAAQLEVRYHNILSLKDKIIPVIAEHKKEIDGFYRVLNVQANLSDFFGSVKYFNWSMTLVREGREGSCDFESKLVGAGRKQNHSLTPIRWHAAPQGHTGYFTGSTSPSIVNRQLSNGANIPVYLSVPDFDPQWSVSLEDYYKGAVSIEVKGNAYYGDRIPDEPTDWRMGNGLVRVFPDATNPGIFNVQHWHGSSGLTGVFNWYPAGRQYRLKINTTNVSTAWDSMSVLRNDPEESIIRLTRGNNPGKTVMDISLKRGSRSLHFFVRRHAAADLKVEQVLGEAAIAGTGFIRRDGGDIYGQRWVMGSAKTFTADTIQGGITRTATTEFDFFVSLEVGGFGAVTGDSAANLTTQYLGTPAEQIGIIKK